MPVGVGHVGRPLAPGAVDGRADTLGPGRHELGEGGVDVGHLEPELEAGSGGVGSAEGTAQRGGHRFPLVEGEAGGPGIELGIGAGAVTEGEPKAAHVEFEGPVEIVDHEHDVIRSPQLHAFYSGGQQAITGTGEALGELGALPGGPVDLSPACP